MSLIELSEKLLYAVKTRAAWDSYIDELSRCSIEELNKQIDTDPKKMVFWINMYNALYQILRVHKDVSTDKIYTVTALKIADGRFSLDDIEHGILRRYRYKYSLGLIANVFAGRHIKKLAVKQVDYRIHFALNCGAVSCPPIAFYNLEDLDRQLDMATQSFLEQETVLDKEKKVAHLTRLFLWFYFDFGGRKGINRIYLDQLNTDLSGYKIKFRDYDWQEHLDNFSE